MRADSYAYAKNILPTTTLIYSTSNYYKEENHRFVANFAMTALADFDRQIDDRLLPKGFALALRQRIFFLSAISGRLLINFHGQLPLYVLDINMVWHHVDAIENLQVILLERILQDGTAHQKYTKKTPFAKIFNTILIFFKRKQNNSKNYILSTNSKSKMGVKQSAQEIEQDYVRLLLLQASFKNYVDLLYSCVKQRSDFFILQEKFYLEKDKIQINFSSTLMNQAWQYYTPYVNEAYNTFSTIVRVLKKYFSNGAALPNATILSEANEVSAMGMLEVCSKYQIKNIIVNHNSHPKHPNDLANNLIETLCHHRHGWGVFDGIFLHWSSPCFIQPVLPFKHYSFTESQTVKSASKRLRVLYADNYQNWHEYIPYITQTSDEILSNIKILIDVVRSHKDIDLCLRIRSKSEVNPNIIKSLLNVDDTNIIVSECESSIVEALQHSDLLIAFFSTTIEQALLMKVPVLLWGEHKKAFLFEENRYIFHANNKIDLSKKIEYIKNNIEAIKTFHQADSCWSMPKSLSLTKTLSDICR